MQRQTQGSMALVGVISAGIFIVAFVALMVVGGHGFTTALFLGGAVALGAALFLLKAFHGKPLPPANAAAPRAAAPKAEPVAAPAPAAAPAASAKPSAPARLEAARDGTPDDLKKIKGVGKKLEAQLNGMGIYHFDQIAGWSEGDVAWMDENLEGFKGRVSRDDWVGQARTLAGGGETAFSKKVEDGDVY